MKKSLRLTETAIMLALGFILSMLKIVDMPFGGSVTAFSMVPIILIAYRYGTKWGLLAGFAASLLQMLMGLKNLTYATGAAAVIAIIFLDYVIAFAVMGLGGIFKGKIKDQGLAVGAAALVVCVLRYICHVISGCTVWAGVSIPTSDGLLYSFVYNATYMIPETLVTVVGAYYAAKVFTLSTEQVKRIPLDNKASRNMVSSIPAVLSVVISFVLICAMFQTEDGGFDVTAITRTSFWSWLPVVITLAVGIAATVIIKNVAFKNKA
ncbi:MAG: energy-coupled thiamine transporter ThiT [Firmicutes bacterium]|nr:energy-coupled thiamine transporter ThiT [[Eubacterium] siraeum]MCM1488221.1 energy-coupled thiamine transporter ThiT [Bacillota bacterium]